MCLAMASMSVDMPSRKLMLTDFSCSRTKSDLSEPSSSVSLLGPPPSSMPRTTDPWLCSKSTSMRKHARIDR